MSLYINTNSSAAYASFHLGRNNKSLHESLVRLSSGKRINNPGDDSGGLAVSMKLSSSINRLNAAGVIYKMQYHSLKCKMVYSKRRAELWTA